MQAEQTVVLMQKEQMEGHEALIVVRLSKKPGSAMQRLVTVKRLRWSIDGLQSRQSPPSVQNKQSYGHRVQVWVLLTPTYLSGQTA